MFRKLSIPVCLFASLLLSDIYALETSLSTNQTIAKSFSNATANTSEAREIPRLGYQVCYSDFWHTVYCRGSFYCSECDRCCCGAPGFYCAQSGECCCENADGVCCNGFCCNQEKPNCCADERNIENSICCADGMECCERPAGATITKECITTSSGVLQTTTSSEIINRTEDIAFTIPSPAGNLQVYALPVGQGDCTIIQCPTGQIIVVDCGSSGGNRLTSQQIQLFLGNRIGDVVAIIVSHPDRDHFNYLYSINWQTTSIRSVIIGGTIQDYNRSNQEFMMMFNWLMNFNNTGKLQTISNGQQCIGNCIVAGGTNFCSNLNIPFNILAANVGPTSNQKSIVMKVSLGAFSLLLPGDIEGPAATAIAGNPAVLQQLHSVVYKMAHHGASASANQPAWLAPILPQVAFASSAYNFGNCRHPRCITISRLLNLGTIVPSQPHTFYCGNTGAPTQLNAFCRHMYETSPRPNMICMLGYTSTGQFDQQCYQMLEKSDGVEDDECPQEEDIEDGGASTIIVGPMVIITLLFLDFLIG